MDAHESTHVKQFEDMKNSVEKDLKAMFSKEVCYLTTEERDKHLAQMKGLYGDWKNIAIPSYIKKYKTDGPTVMNRAEREAVKAEAAALEQEYQEHLRNQN